MSLLPQMKNLQHPQPQLLLQTGRTTNAVICMHCQAQAKSERERGKEGSRKKVKSGGRQIGTIRVVAVRVGVEFVTGLWISQTRIGDWGQRIQAWRDALRLDTFLGRFLLSFFYALLGPNGKHIYLPDCHWVVCWVHCVCRACACVCVVVCVSHSMQIATGRRPDTTGISLPWRTVARCSLMLLKLSMSIRFWETLV